MSLALDLLEEFRSPLCDKLALTLVNRGQIKHKHFEERVGGSVFLTEQGRKIVIYAFQKKKSELLKHPLLDTSVPVALLPLIQARLLARYLRRDVQEYIPYLQK